MTRQQRVVVGLSGGVDSSVAAHLLKAQGFDITGLFMKNWEEDDSDGYCSAREDISDAQKVSEALGIDFDKINFSERYWDQVFEHFLQELSSGRTPNPDILCNKEIKFKAFLNHALSIGADYIATGHYVRKDQDPDNGAYRLLKGRDPQKDQSYFLYTLGQEQLAKALFPVGELQKSEVRQIAKQQAFVTHNKKDSTGICFIGERKFTEFLKRYLPAQPGVIQTPEGDVLGEHQGLMYYTLGQRQGLGIGGLKQGDGTPWYVVAKDLKNNVLIVGQGHDHPLLFSQGLTANQVSWVQGADFLAPGAEMACQAKVRYRQEVQDCTVIVSAQDALRVVFKQKQRAVTPGQSVVFYQGDVCLGGAIIDQLLPEA